MKVKNTMVEKRDISVIPEIVAEAKKFGRRSGQVILPSKRVDQMVKMILMTAMTVSLVTSAIILTQNGDSNIAFAKKATTATDTGKTSKGTSSPSTMTDTGAKDGGKGKDTSGSGSTSSSSSSGSTSGSGSTTGNGNGNSNGNGAVKTKGVTNTARPPGSVVDPNHIFYDKCKPGEQRNPTTHLCIKNLHPGGLCGKINGVTSIAGCCDTKKKGVSQHALCPKPTPRPNPPCNISGGGAAVSSAMCHCQAPAACPSPNHPLRTEAYMKKYNAGWNQACVDDMKHTLYHKTAPHSKAWSDGYFDAIQGDGPCP